MAEQTRTNLTLTELLLAYHSATQPLWVRRIREAEHVDVRPTSHVDGQTIYILDMRESFMPEDRVLIICVPVHVMAVRAAVQGLRGQR